MKRFLAKVNKTDTCWLWTGAVAGRLRVYGCMKYKGSSVYAHRVAFDLFNGYLPKYVLHSCDNAACVNPEHLREGTQLENVRECRDRQASLNQSLTRKEVIIIKVALSSGTPRKTLRERFGVSAATIKKIDLGVTWSDVRQ